MQTETTASQVSQSIARQSNRGSRTRRGLPHDAPLLVGRLILTITPRRPLVLTLAVWCPWCKREHFHGWPDAARLDGVTHRVAHCADSPLRADGYFIGLDAARAAEHRKTLVEFRRLNCETPTIRRF